MLRQRVIPTLLLKNGRMVKGVNFSNHVDVGHPVTAAKIYNAQGADELFFLDIDFVTRKKEITLRIIEETAENCFVPLTVGGGIESILDIQNFLNAGADKISINTAAVKNPALLKEASKKYGAQCIVASVDVRLKDKKYEVFIYSGIVATGLEAIEWCKKLRDCGVGEIMITSIDREGTMKGYDIDLIKNIANAVDIPVIASGGAGTLEHLEEALKIDNISAISASSIFHFTDQSPIKARFYLSSKNLNVRSRF